MCAKTDMLNMPEYLCGGYLEKIPLVFDIVPSDKNIIWDTYLLNINILGEGHVWSWSDFQ